MNSGRNLKYYLTENIIPFAKLFINFGILFINQFNFNDYFSLGVKFQFKRVQEKISVVRRSN